jgi:phage tail sheath protein FI
MAYKTPGVYVVEKNAFPNSVVEVATAVPAFIGYTEKADNKGESLSKKAWRITSMAEYEAYYGGAPKSQFTIDDDKADKTTRDFVMNGEDHFLTAPAQAFRMFVSMRLFFQNGGGACYIVSVGDYKATINKDDLEGGIKPLLKEQEPTMVLVPEAVSLENPDDCYSLQVQMLQHCGFDMKNRFALLDVHQGYKDRAAPGGDVVNKFRDGLTSNFRNFGAAYYPWVHTTIVSLKDLDFTNFADADKAKLKDLITKELGAALTPTGDPIKDAKIKGMTDAIGQITDAFGDDADGLAKRDALNNTLMAISPVYKNILLAAQRKLNLLPPAAGMAGLYTMVDNTRGVWKAPANVGLASVSKPAVELTNDEQEDLNVTTAGKSINAIRSFIGEGTIVWGARTLDGNSLDWRYINVRRTMIMLEESLRLACKAYVFEPNVANTWVTIKSMASNFLTGIWKRGGLAGASPDDAFSVSVGLNETMTSEDILEGILRVTILVAISRPAEFIELTFQQQMQKS